MNCEQAQGLISAWVDRQLAPADQTELEQHLAACAECRRIAESVRDLHADLTRAFASPRAAAARTAEQVIVAMQTAATPVSPTAPLTAKPRWPNWISLALAMAIGFLLAVLVLSPWKSRQAAGDRHETSNDRSVVIPTPPAAAPVARLVVATGPDGVEYNDRTRKAWQPVAQLAQFQCPSEGSVRTSDKVRCELVTSEGCVVRMNSGTEIVFRAPGQVELKHGEIWCRSTPQASLEVLPASSAAVVKHTVPAKAPSLWSCTASDAACLLSVNKSGDAVRVTVVTGMVSIKDRNENVQLAPSQTAVITGERIDREQWSDGLLAASWMQPLLMRKGHADRDLAERVDDLLARTGEAKQPELYETEIRSLGEYSVLPLLRYVESPRSDSNPRRRQAAMRIISDLAPAWAIGDLVGLLKHPDADVRVFAATALQRLTQETQGASNVTWRGTPAQRQPAAAAWQTWWSKNSDRYPSYFDAPRLPVEKVDRRK
jgi:hypothetical protein